MPPPVIHQDNDAGRGERRRVLRIIDPEKAIVQVENFMVATSQISQTTLRSVLGQHVLDELCRAGQDQHDPSADHRRGDVALGVKVSIVEVKDVEIPAGMQRAMAGRPKRSANDARR